MDFIPTESLSWYELILAAPESLKIVLLSTFSFLIIVITLLIVPKTREKISKFFEDPLGSAFFIFGLVFVVAFLFSAPMMSELAIQKENIYKKYDLPEDSKIYQSGKFWEVYYTDDEIRKSVKFKVKLDENGEPFDYDTKKSVKKAIDRIDRTKNL